MPLLLAAILEGSTFPFNDYIKYVEKAAHLTTSISQEVIDSARVEYQAVAAEAAILEGKSAHDIDEDVQEAMRARDAMRSRATTSVSEEVDRASTTKKVSQVMPHDDEAA